MAESVTNREEWIKEIDSEVKAKVGEDQWKNSRLSAFVIEVALWLHEEAARDDDDTIDTAAGLIKYGITNQKELGNVPDNKKDFRDKLKPQGVVPAICDSLFIKYVAPQHSTRGRPA